MTFACMLFVQIGKTQSFDQQIHRIPKELLFTSEEEIAKWREERRKMYPTVARVREKLVEEEAKIERGETAKDEVHRYPHYDTRTCIANSDAV